MATLPATGSQIQMGRVYAAYATNSYPPAAGSNVRLSNTLGVSYGGKASGAVISFSSTFGGKVTPYTY